MPNGCWRRIAAASGRTRRELHRAVGDVLAQADDCPARRIDAFCKLLDDASVYERDRRGQAAALRREVFHAAAASHPLVRKADRLFEHEEHAVKAAIAENLDRPWPEIDRELFADVIDFHRLREFPGYADGPALLARYNVAQVQAALFGATSMTVWAADDFKTIVRYAKLARLMHTITSLEADKNVCPTDRSACPTGKTACPSRDIASGSTGRRRCCARRAATARRWPDSCPPWSPAETGGCMRSSPRGGRAGPWA